MWNCPNCSETHEDQFDACWKCGSARNGQRNPNFQIVDTAPNDSAADDDVSERPDVRLPTVTYFCIPIWLWYQLIQMPFELQSFPSGHPQLPTTLAGWAFEIGTTLLIACFIGIPIFASMARAIYLSICRRIPGEIWILSMFLLPQDFRTRHAWFVPIYYGSIIAGVVLPLAFIIWQMSQHTVVLRGPPQLHVTRR